MTNTENFIDELIEENSLIEAFTHFYEAGGNIFSSPLLGKVSNRNLINTFISEVMGGEQYEVYAPIDLISESEARMLLRQMAMFRIHGKNKKEKHYTPAEAKLAANEMMAFLGSHAEFYTNVLSVDLPHDNPGRVMSSDSEGTCNSITLFAINDKYLIYIEQYWTDG
jgi:hypothetical protein